VHVFVDVLELSHEIEYGILYKPIEMNKYQLEFYKFFNCTE